MEVIRTLLDRCKTLVTQEEDKQKEREQGSSNEMPVSTMDHINSTEKDEKEGRQHHEENGRKNKGKGKVVLPYVQGLSETSRIMKKYNVNTPLKPHNTTKNSLVRPKHKNVELQQMCERMYSLACKNCYATYYKNIILIQHF